MKAQIITLSKLAGKAILIVLLLSILSACQEEKMVASEPYYGETRILNNGNDNSGTNSQAHSSIFHLDFESSLTASNDSRPYYSGNLQFTSGISGEGICFGRYDTLQYLVADNIDYRQGSLSVWIKPNWSPGTLLYKILYYGRNPKHFEMHVDENLLVAFGLNSASMDNKDIRVAFGDAFHWQPGEWHHLAYTWSSEEIGLFIDGVLVEKTQVGYEIPEVSDSVFHIGSVDGFEGFDGVMDELSIYKHPLDEAEVSSLYQLFEQNISEAYTEDCHQ